MRTLTTLTVVIILIFAVGTAAAEDYRPDYDQQNLNQSQFLKLETDGLSTSTLSPQLLEIHEVYKVAAEAESKLLIQLAATQDAIVVEQLVSRLEILYTNRTLDILKIRAHYAQIEGHHNLAFRLRLEILELAKKDDGPPM